MKEVDTWILELFSVYSLSAGVLWYCMLFREFIYFSGFLRKVYGILTFQLLLTALVGFIFMMNDGVKHFVQTK